MWYWVSDIVCDDTKKTLQEIIVNYSLIELAIAYISSKLCIMGKKTMELWFTMEKTMWCGYGNIWPVNH